MKYEPLNDRIIDKIKGVNSLKWSFNGVLLSFLLYFYYINNVTFNTLNLLHINFTFDIFIFIVFNTLKLLYNNFVFGIFIFISFVFIVESLKDLLIWIIFYLKNSKTHNEIEWKCLLIKGAWGSGKTTYYKNNYKNKDKKIDIYISCFAASRVELISHIIKQQWLYKILTLNGILTKFIIDSWEVFMPRNRTIVFDDLERLHKNENDYQDLMAIIDFLKNNNKVILIANTKGTNNIFNLYLERIIEQNIQIPQIKYETLFKEKELHYESKEIITYLDNTNMYEKCNNLRIIKNFINQFNLNLVNKLSKDTNFEAIFKILKKIDPTYFTRSIESYLLLYYLSFKNNKLCNKLIENNNLNNLSMLNLSSKCRLYKQFNNNDSHINFLNVITDLKSNPELSHLNKKLNFTEEEYKELYKIFGGNNIKSYVYKISNLASLTQEDINNIINNICTIDFIYNTKNICNHLLYNLYKHEPIEMEDSQNPLNFIKNLKNKHNNLKHFINNRTIISDVMKQENIKLLLPRDLHLLNSTSNTTDKFIELILKIIILFHYTDKKEINDYLNNIDKSTRNKIASNIKEIFLKENPEEYLYKYINMLILWIIDENDIINNLADNKILTNINNKVEKLLDKITSYD